ncbi:hypothetical protein STCU_12007 [Strigomonas culicis]|uniref:Uncharacterized protein n=1 Tax=Strigomonas culicis TaxID=28005 RepID=S9TGI6_9TRYP|nr:hypothetical protein STCU_12007 [Strigomonas culicis]|eukprot:EPY15468.1 hypothetical protein STCU_12007 [Strigomonas culicis]
MFQRTALRRLFSKPITQGYVAQLPPAPASHGARGHSWARAAAAHPGVGAHYYSSGSFAAERMIVEDGDLPAEAEAAVAERYAAWYARTYGVEAGERCTAAQEQQGDAAARAEVDACDLEGLQEELTYWAEEFHHNTLVR